MGIATQEQAEAILDAIRKSDAEREASMPTYQAALHQALSARERLKKLGWRDGIYCPKDGTSFALVEWGSTGVHPGHYMGEWPTGDVYCNDFMVPPHAIMWKALDKLSDDERAALDASAANAKEFMERQLQAFSTCQE